MATQIKLRRGTTAQNNAFTGAEGEVTVDTEKDVLVVHDGVTLGGFPSLNSKKTNTITANSTSPALTITQTGTGNAFVVEDSESPDTTPFVIDSGGLVFAGNTSSITTAVNSSNFANIKLQISGVDGNASGLLQTAYGTSTTMPVHAFARSRGVTLGSHASVSSGDNIGIMSFAGSDGTGFIEGARITAAVDGTPSTNDMPGRLVFSTTADGASSPSERMRIGNHGGVSIGGSGTASVPLYIQRDITGGTTAYGVFVNGTIQSDVTSNCYLYASNVSTQAAAFTIGALSHFYAVQNTLGAGSSVTNQFGFNATSVLTGATNNYGFYGNIPTGTGRWNFYAAGTAANYFAGETTVNSGLTIGRTAVTAPAASDGNVFSGTYTPTITNVTNVATSTSTQCQYMRVGNVVTVSGQIDIDPTTTGLTEFRLSLPIASNFSGNNNCGGGGANNLGEGIRIRSDAATDLAHFSTTTANTANIGYNFSFTYRVI